MIEQKAGHIPFSIDGTSTKPVLFDDMSSQWLTYAELAAMASNWAEEFARPRALVFLYLKNTVTSVAAFLGALKAGHVVALLDANLPAESKNRLEENYSPEIIFSCLDGGKVDVCVTDMVSSTLHPDLSVLLSTSGSTGDPKFVRLTHENLLTNAKAIANALDIGADDIAAGYLPLHYSYGLSVLTSHLMAGGRILLTEKGLMDREFWPLIKDQGVSHFPGVPFHFQTMNRFGFKRLGLENVKTLTQAGGRLDTEIKRSAHAFMSEVGGRFHVMYGQTEASPRITTLSHLDFPANAETVGPALEGGRLSIRNEEGRDLPLKEEGNVFYHGPNVMMGYADCRADLALGDEQGGWLDTGDLGFLDEEGRLTLTGRSGRVGKIYGLRVNLDAIEQLAQSVAKAAVLQKENSVVIFHANTDNADENKNRMLDLFKARFTLPLTAYRFIILADLPTTDRGKLDYIALGAML